MQLFFETQLALTKIEGKLYFFQEEPEMVPEPVMVPEGHGDGNRIDARTVLYNDGRFHMWYTAFPDFKDEELETVTAYAYSKDGFEWKKPALDLVKTGSHKNNYCDIGLASPAVFIDPESPPSHRYRATGYLRPQEGSANPQGTIGSFYTAHSADGLHWDLDSPEPRWFSGDAIKSIYHPVQRRGICAMKFVRRMNGIHRRSIWTAFLEKGVWGDPVCALVPDEFDDTAAIARGRNSTDYYNMSMLPAGMGTVGFICNFRHRLPLSMKPEHYAVFGDSDITLAYQAGPGDRWLHFPGRTSFFKPGALPWTAGWIGIATCPVPVEDEHWLYFNASPYDHAWHMNVNWQEEKKWTEYRAKHGPDGCIGLLKWPKWRLFGCHADPEGTIDVELGEIKQPSELLLNYKTEPEGCIRVQIFNREGRGDCGEISGRSGDADVIPLTGDSVGETVKWKDGPVIQPTSGKRGVMRLTMENARAYAWELRPAGEKVNGI